MAGQVRVEDLEVFRVFRAAMLKFGQAAEQSIIGADAEIARVQSWLTTEQTTYWQSQIRKRADMVTEAREAVRKKKLYKDSTGRTPSAVEEEKHLARCIAALQHAEEKLQATKKWAPRLEKESELYRGGVARLGQDVTTEIPRAVALLDRLATRLEEYIAIETPAGAPSVAAGSPGSEVEMVRGGETEAAGPATSAATEGESERGSSGEGAAEKKEAGDGSSGK